MPSAVDWKAFLRPEERERLAAIAGEQQELVAERRRIYRRCRKRALTAAKKEIAS